MPYSNRREFLRTVAVLGAVPFLDCLPTGLMPVAFAQSGIAGKDKLRVLNDRPINAETPVTLLDPSVTPTDLHFVRNNGLISDRAQQAQLGDWTLTIDGEVDTPLTLTLEQLQKRFAEHTAQLVLECGGNGRAGFYPTAKGNQWTLGAVGCSTWTGVLLKDVLQAAGVKKSAVYTGYYGEDRHASGDATKDAISRGVPIEKALDGHCMLAWAHNGQPLSKYHGFPLRLICPGYPASTSGKWLKRITLRNVVHDGAKMGGMAYRVPKFPTEPGEQVADADMKIIEVMPVKSIITSPGTGQQHALGEELAVRGHAWAGSGDVSAVHISIDFGATWQAAELSPPPNKYAWQRWTASVKLPLPGYYEVWARATDTDGVMQPMVIPGWNPKGYLNNAMHRIAVEAGV